MSLGIRDGMGAALGDGEPGARARGDVRDETCAVDAARAELEVRLARAGERPGAEKGAAEVCAAAARAAHDAFRRMLERRARRRQDARLAEDTERARVAIDVQLVASRLVERAPPVRADLGAHAEIAQQRERAPRRRRAREVEMQADASAAEMPCTGGVKERRELGEPATPPRRGDLRELFAQ